MCVCVHAHACAHGITCVFASRWTFIVWMGGLRVFIKYVTSSFAYLWVFMMLFLLTDTNCFLVSVNMYDIGVCMYMCIYRYVCVCPCMWKPEVMSGGVFSLSSLHFLRLGLSLNVEVSVGLGWLAGEFQSSICLYLPRAEITDTLRLIWILRLYMEPQLQSLCLSGKHVTDCWEIVHCNFYCNYDINYL